MELAKEEAGCIGIPRILLPREADIYTWAVIACDQFTGDAAYWKNVEELTRGKYSTYHLIYPEIYLKSGRKERTEAINKAMARYLEEGVFKECEEGFILTERTFGGRVRTGIMLAVDLESYSFRVGDGALIRSTEETVEDRLPPRVDIRRGAALELPHIMLLYDDPEFKVLSAAERGDILYDSRLNMGGGSIKCTFIKNSRQVRDAFYSLCTEDGMLFAVGDGNHSLAAAKLMWEEVKRGLDGESKKVHPARFALCEAVNIYDPALIFHPIHRFVRTASPLEFIDGWNICGSQNVEILYGASKTSLPFPEDIPSGIRQLDDYIAAFIAEHGGEVDYIHGDEQVNALSCHGVGVLLPAMQKGDFFGLIERQGNLPKKTFSMGEGREKRYYIEAKRIK